MGHLKSKLISPAFRVVSPPLPGLSFPGQLLLIWEMTSGVPWGSGCPTQPGKFWRSFRYSLGLGSCTLVHRRSREQDIKAPHSPASLATSYLLLRNSSHLMQLRNGRSWLQLGADYGELLPGRCNERTWHWHIIMGMLGGSWVVKVGFGGLYAGVAESLRWARCYSGFFSPLLWLIASIGRGSSGSVRMREGFAYPKSPTAAPPLVSIIHRQ